MMTHSDTPDFKHKALSACKHLADTGTKHAVESYSYSYTTISQPILLILPSLAYITTKHPNIQAGDVAQWLESRDSNPKTQGSIP